MACCAFAAFLLVQLLAPFRSLRRRLFGEPLAAVSAVAWRRGDSGPALPSTGGRALGARWRSVLALVIAADAILLGAYTLQSTAAAQGQRPAGDVDAWHELVAVHTVWCSALK